MSLLAAKSVCYKSGGAYGPSATKNVPPELPQKVNISFLKRGLESPPKFATLKWESDKTDKTVAIAAFSKPSLVFDSKMLRLLSPIPIGIILISIVLQQVGIGWHCNYFLLTYLLPQASGWYIFTLFELY